MAHSADGSRDLRSQTSPSQPSVAISGLIKTYASGQQALKRVDLEIQRGEIFALLGPNGAGKTTLIGIVCGIVTPSAGSVLINGLDHRTHYRETRRRIGLVPQELSTDAFESVWDTVSFSRGLFGCAPKPAYIEQLLRDLSLWDKKDQKILALSGGMKRRVLIAKALSHEPEILFLDEPTAGVDVSLRREMWNLVRGLRERGVTIILTTHYIQEAEEMADRIGVINRGELILVEGKEALMAKLGRRYLTLQLTQPLAAVPAQLEGFELRLEKDGKQLEYCFNAKEREAQIPALLEKLASLGIKFTDLETRESSLEEIFVGLLHADQTHADQTHADGA